MSDASGRSCATELVAALKETGFNFFVGVPCPALKGLVSRLDGGPLARFIPATREDIAIGMASGAWLGGRQPAVLLQSAGLVTSASALASLSAAHEIPALLVVSSRGEKGSGPPEPGVLHEDEIAIRILDLLQIAHRALTAGAPTVHHVRWAADVMRSTRKPAALIVPAGVLE